MPPRIFVSYSRVDRKVTERLVARLRRVYEHEDVWYDAELVGGDRWWKSILTAIADCDVFLFLLSNESVTSPYCLAEFKEAQRLQKPVVTVQVRDRTKLTGDLSEIQYVDMGTGITEDAFDDLLRAVRRQAALPKNRRALWTPATSLPTLPSAEDEISTSVPVRDTPNLRVELPSPANTNGLMRYVAAALTLVVLVGALALIVPPLLNREATTVAPTLMPSPEPTDTRAPTLAPTLTDLEAALERARNFAGTQNTDWQPFPYTFPDDPAAAPMVLVPVGSFQMGNPDGVGEDDEHPMHTQTFSEPFWIDQTEVTRAQYVSCIQAGACTATPGSQYSTRDTQPINRVTWFQARDYCIWRGENYRLPQEREWEYAARGIEIWIYPWGNNDPTAELAVFGRLSTTAGVGSKSPAGDSWVGAQDLSGNVWEWVNSLVMAYEAVYNPADGRETDTGDRTDVLRVLRGGSFFGSSYGVRGANRFGDTPGDEYDFVGFRCVRDA